MILTAEERFADNLVLGVWAVIALVGTAQECPDIAHAMALLSKAERILTGIIPHMARHALLGLSGSEPPTLQ